MKLMCISDLVYPMTVPEFKKNCWERQTAYFCKNGTHFSELISSNLIANLLGNCESLRAGLRTSGGTNLFLNSFNANLIPSLYSVGATICARGIDNSDGLFGAIANQAKEQLNFIGKVDFRCYLSGARAGFSIHYDARHSFTIQIEGEKEWKVSDKPSILLPKKNATPASIKGRIEISKNKKHLKIASSPDQCNFDTITLAPGDVLFLPAGTWHEAFSQKHSLALNLSLDYNVYEN